MILLSDIKEVNQERVLSSYGINYERFLALPRDLQHELLYGFNAKVLQMREVRQDNLIKKLSKMLKR